MESRKATAVENGGSSSSLHRPKKIVTKSPSRAITTITNGSGGAPLKSKPDVAARKGSWHAHISPYSRADEVANGGKDARIASGLTSSLPE